MVGVCAGNPKQDGLQLGDLLVPRAIFLDDGKEYANGAQGRTETDPVKINKTLWTIVGGVGEEDAPWVKHIPEKLIMKPPVAPKKERPPIIHRYELCTGNTVKVNADWEAMAERVGRKLTGYEMEGFGFYNGCELYLGSSKRIFVKGVSDYASKDTKISDKSYQKYCCASATAFICYLAKLGKVSLFQTGDTVTDQGFPISFETSQTDMSVYDKIPTNQLMDAIARVADPEKCLKAASHLNMWKRAKELQIRHDTWNVMRSILEEYKDEHGESKARRDFIEACVTAKLEGALKDELKLRKSMP